MLLLELDLSELLAASHHMLILDTHGRSGRGEDGSSVLDVLSSEVLLEGREILEIILVDIGEGNTGGGLAVNELTKGGLVLDDTVRNILGSAETREESHELDGLNIVSNDDKLGLTFFNESGDMVETELKNVWLITTGLTFLLSSLLESFLLLLSGLWSILGEELEELGSLVLVNGLLELCVQALPFLGPTT